jgi:hypothetical protein
MGADAFDGEGGGISGEGLVLDIARGFAIDGVGEIGAELFRSTLSTPRPISSSGVNRILMAPCLICGFCSRKCAASMISARPALLSAPNSVVPSDVTMSWPI